MTDPVHILVVDDDQRLRELLKRYLTGEGYRVTTACDAADARRVMSSLAFDLLILDVMMPGETGLEFARDLRKASGIPILMLTAMGETEDRIGGLEAGADDYLPKPFEPRELTLRIQSILRRAPAEKTPERPGRVHLGPYVFDLSRQILLKDEHPVKLTTTETELLLALAGEPGRIMSREELTRLCDIDGGDRTVDVQVTRLRRKIEDDPRVPRYLHTVRGRGYVLRPD